MLGYISAFLLALSLILGGTLMMDTRQDAAVVGALNTNTDAVIAVTNATQSLIDSQNSLRADVGEVKSDIAGVKDEIGEIKSDIAALKQGQVAGTAPQIVIISPGNAPQPVVAGAAQSTNDKPVLSLKPLR